MGMKKTILFRLLSIRLTTFLSCCLDFADKIEKEFLPSQVSVDVRSEAQVTQSEDRNTHGFESVLLTSCLLVPFSC